MSGWLIHGEVGGVTPGEVDGRALCVGVSLCVCSRRQYTLLMCNR